MKYGEDKFRGMIAGAYALWLARKNDQVDIVDLKDFLKSAESNIDIRLFLQQQLEDHWDQYRKYITAFDLDVLEKFILETSPNNPHSYIQSMQKHLKKLVAQLLDVQTSDRVADFGTGAGDFLCYLQKQVPDAYYWGDEIGTDAFAIAKIRAAIIGENRIEVVQEDMFCGAKSNGLEFDKAFCYPPFGMRMGKMPNIENFLLTQPALPVVKGTCSGEWFFALKMLSCLKENGRGVLMMPIGGLFNQLDNSIRKYFLERNLIETVIKLPNKVLDYMSLPVALIVFNKKNNEMVNLVDASQLEFKKNSSDFSVEKLCSFITAINEDKFTWESVKFENTTILTANMADTPIPCIAKVDYRDLIVRGNMDPAHYTREEIIIPYEDKFESAIEEIFRGALISSAELDDIKTDATTSYQYLTPAGIQDGFISNELQYLSDGAGKYKRYYLQSGDLVITKNGSPFKVAIAEVSPKQMIIASGNVFVIRLKEKKADRFYIKAFLESDKGQGILARAAVGSVMPMLTINALKDMSISLPPLPKQLKVSCRYKAKMNEIVLLKRNLAQAMASLGQIFDSTEE
jgi:type I restriction enzyme M protein